MNNAKLRGKIAELGLNQKQVSELANIKTPTFCRKMSGKCEWDVLEAVRISNVLNLTDEERIEIFLS